MIRVELPWTVLASVNVRTNPAGWGKMKGRQFLTEKYRDALNAARIMVAAAVRGMIPVHPAGPVEVVMRFHKPDRRAKRDCGNFVKLVEDALTGFAYADDAQIRRLTWEDCGVDREAPRVLVTITPYMEG